MSILAKMGPPKNGKMSFLMIKRCLVFNQVDALTSSCTKALSYKQIAFMIITKLLRNVNFGKNGYPQKWQNVSFDDKNMFSI